jgi:hypothetical protein
MKEITFSRVFPAYHPRKGEPTYFVEQMLKQLIADGKASTEDLKGEFVDCAKLLKVGYKSHTIRKGHHFKEGDYFKPKVWTNLPYKSVKHQFAPPVMVEKTFDFILDKANFFVNGSTYGLKQLERLAMNDGLSCEDFECWFNSAPFDGQIICWNTELIY